MKHRNGLGIVRLAALAIACGVSGCGAEGMNGEEATEVEQAAFAPVKGDVGFVQSNLTSGTGPVSAPSAFSFNSSGATNVLRRTGTGTYRVDMPNLGATVGGHVEVTAFGNGNRRCKVAGWGSSGSTLQISVNCFNNGTPIDAVFMLNYIRRSDTPGADTAYVWAFDQSSPSYDAASLYSYNSTGGANTITHTPGTGSYAVSLAGQDLSKGTVEVTAYGSGSAYCKVVSWFGSSVNVACFDGALGTPVESRFTVLFSTRSPNGTPSSSYLWANQPSTPTYNPDPNYALGLLSVDCCTDPMVVSTPPTITRSSAGIYSVRLPNMASLSASPRNVKVTAYGTGSAACMITSATTSGVDGLVGVKCFDPLGPAVDSLFTLTYSSFAFTIG
jgi:hypothetical protein